VLVERSAAAFGGIRIGDSLSLSLRDGPLIEVEVAGITHDPSLPPANTEQAIYVFAGPETLEKIGRNVVMDELCVRFVQDGLADETQAERFERLAGELATWLYSQGVSV